MLDNKKVPKLRFPEFTDDWEQRKLGDIATLTSSKRVHVSDYVDDGIPFFRGSEISKLGDNSILEDVLYISVELYENLKQKYGVPQENDILITAVGTLGNSFVVKENKPFYFKDGNLIWLKNINIDSNYLNVYLSGGLGKDRVLNSAAGSNQKALTMVKLQDVVVDCPSIEEQKKISSYFNNLDNLITLHQRKCEGTKKLKKYLLQKMFPKNGVKTPEIRFPEFTDDWEQRKVSELCSISTGKSNTQDKVEDGEYPFYVRSPIIERSTKYLYDEEAVLTVGDGVGTGKVFHYVNGKYDLHQRCYRMYDFTDELNAHYFYHTFSKLFYKRVMAMTAKTSVDSVRLEMIADMEIPCPNIQEQVKIGAYFDNLDNLITLHQRKVDSLKVLKKYLLQNMFV